MPKEQINYPTPTLTHHSCGLAGDSNDDGPCTCTPTMDSWPALFVRWHAAGHDRTGNVQISLAEYPKLTQAEYDELNQWPPTPASETYSASLTRSELNDLIRMLRRARDQAYGRDE